METHLCHKIISHTTTTQKQKFSKFNKENIAQRHSLKPKTNRNFKALLGQITSTTNTVEFLVCVFFFSNSTTALKIMAGHWSLTVIKAFLTAEKSCQMVTMTTTTQI